MRCRSWTARLLQLDKHELLDKFQEYDFDLVGISAFSTQHPAVKLLARYIKKHYQVPIILGGPLPTYQPEFALRTTEVDVCVIGGGRGGRGSGAGSL